MLFKSIRVQNDYAREFSVLLLAKFLKGVERVDLELIEPFNSLVDTILELELFRTQEMKYLPIYSALCVVFFRLVESSTVYKEHIVKWLSKLMRQIEMDLFEERCRLIEDVPHLRALGFLMAVIAEMLGHLR